MEARFGSIIAGITVQTYLSRRAGFQSLDCRAGGEAPTRRMQTNSGHGGMAGYLHPVQYAAVSDGAGLAAQV